MASACAVRAPPADAAPAARAPVTQRLRPPGTRAQRTQAALVAVCVVLVCCHLVWLRGGPQQHAGSERGAVAAPDLAPPASSSPPPAPPSAPSRPAPMPAPPAPPVVHTAPAALDMAAVAQFELPINRSLSARAAQWMRTLPPFDARFANPCWWDRAPAGQCGDDGGGGVGAPFACAVLRCIPLCYLAGMDKSGSTDLYINLVRQHADLFQIGVDFEDRPGANFRAHKEPQYWNINFDPDIRTHYADKYFAYGSRELRLHPHRVLMDAQPSALYRFLFATNNTIYGTLGTPFSVILRALVPNARILIILREPGERLLSAFWMSYNHKATPWLAKYRAGSEETAPRTPSSKVDPRAVFHRCVRESIASFRACIAQNPLFVCASNVDALGNACGVASGAYVVWISYWQRLFPPGQVAVLRMEDYSRDPVGEMQRLELRLNLSSTPFAFHKPTAVANKAARPISMFPETRAMLTDFYAPLNAQLALLLRDDRWRSWA